MAGRDKCATHGGKTPLKKNGSGSKYVTRAGIESLGESAQSASLADELDLARGLLGETCDRMAKIKDGDYETEVRTKLANMCASAMFTMMDHVRKLVDTHARVRVMAGDLVSLDSAKLIVLNMVEVVEDEFGSEVADRLVDRLKGRLPVARDSSVLLRRRLEIIYDGGDDQAEILADPYVPAIPASQPELACEVPGLTGRPTNGKNPLGSGKNGS